MCLEIMTVKYDIKNSWPLVVAILLFVYIIYCIITLGFNIFVLFVFFVAIVLNLGLFYLLTHRINRKQMSVKFYRVFITIAYITFFGFFAFVILFNVFFNKKSLSEDESYNYVIVFGSSVSLNNEQNTIINKRIDKAIEYANNHTDTKFIMTGAKVSHDAFEEATYMKEYMIKKGIDESRILTDTMSINTFENISNAIYIIKSDLVKNNIYNNILDSPVSINNSGHNLDYLKIGLLSSDFHLMRINLMSKKLGINEQYDISVESDFLHKLYLYVQETLSLYKAFVLKQI